MGHSSRTLTAKGNNVEHPHWVQMPKSRYEELANSGYWSNETVISRLDHWADTTPDACAVIARSLDRGTRQEITYAQVQDMSFGIAEELRKLGIVPGDVISVQLPNWWEALPITMGVIRAGAVVNPIAPFFRVRELTQMVDRAHSKALWIPFQFRGHDHVGDAVKTLKAVDSLKNVLVVGRVTVNNPHVLSSDAWLTPPEASRPKLPAIDPNGVIELMFTSGTTGEPKGVLHTHNTLAHAWSAFRDVLHVGSDDVPLVAATIGHQTGFLIGLQMSVWMGQTCVFLDIWDPREAWVIVIEEGVTWMHASTAFLRGLLDVSSESRSVGSQHLRLFAAGGMPIPPKIIEAARKELGVKVVSLWGMTENGATTMVPVGDPDTRSEETDGCPVPGSEIRVVDPSSRQELSAGDTGLLMSRGASHFVGYWQRPEYFNDAHDESGWFDTGDLARMDEEGYIRIVGREKDLIVRGGENVPSGEVEEVLLAHPDIGEVAVVGVPDPDLGQRACACVVTESGSTMSLSQMRKYLKAKEVTKQYWPEYIVNVKRLPRTASGKIRKSALREASAEAVSVQFDTPRGADGTDANAR